MAEYTARPAEVDREYDKILAKPPDGMTGGTIVRLRAALNDYYSWRENALVAALDAHLKAEPGATEQARASDWSSYFIGCGNEAARKSPFAVHVERVERAIFAVEEAEVIDPYRHLLDVGGPGGRVAPQHVTHRIGRRDARVVS